MDLPVSHVALNTLAVSLAAGVFLIVIARKLGWPGIVLLLGGGIVLGPEVLGVVQPKSLGDLLPVMVSLAVGLVLFEGGLTLDLRGYQAGSQVIPRLLTIGVLVTWLGAAASVWFVFRYHISFCLLAGSLVIVTGPTVIAPLLRRTKITPKLHDILHWESVLIDAIGVFVAILCFEWIADRDGGRAVAFFAVRVVTGVGIGVGGGWLLAQAYHRRFVPRHLTNSFALGSAVAIFCAAEAFRPEAGLLAVTIAGFVVGLREPGELKSIRQFKGEVTDLLIGFLFIILSARLDLQAFVKAGWPGLAVVGLIVFVVRPLNVVASTVGTDLKFKERLFLAWVAPRGIVAASMASLFALALAESKTLQNPAYLETFAYSVIVATVVLQGFSAGWVAKWLGLKLPDPTGWMIAGAGAFNRKIAQVMRDEAGLDVLLIDNNQRLVAEARREGLEALCEDARNAEIADERREFYKVGHVLALTDNTELNEILCRRWGDALEIDDQLFYWCGAASQNADDRAASGRIIFEGIPRPSVIGGELMSGEAHLELFDAESDEVPGLPVLLLRKGAVFPLGEKAEEIAKQPGDRILALRRSEGFLARSLKVGAAVDLQVKDLHDLYEQILEVAVKAVPAISKEESLQDITQPGKLWPAVIGHGIAIPHIYSRHTPTRLCIFARLPEGLVLPGEPEPLRIVFFLISPTGDSEGHLATLAEIARFCDEKRNRERLMTLKNIESASLFLQSRTMS